MNHLTTLLSLLFVAPIINVLLLIYSLCRDMGASIVLLTALFSLLTSPLTIWQSRSEKVLRELSLEIAEVRKQHAGNAREQKAATLALYKERGVHPIAGVLPILLQLAIAFALSATLGIVLHDSSLSHLNAQLYPFVPPLRHLPGGVLSWLPVVHPGWSIPLGQPDSTLLLPILSGVTTFVQMWLSKAMGATRHESRTSGLWMQVATATLTFVFSLSVTAGLVLYWTSATVFAALLQFLVQKRNSPFPFPHLSVGNRARRSGRRGTPGDNDLDATT